MNRQRFALLSVYDKQGIVEFAKDLNKLGYKIISTDGTSKVLSEAGISVIPIQQITGNPESFDGRVKTISFEVESGILYDRSKSTHRKQAIGLKIRQIDIVACNLYPFEKTIMDWTVTVEEAVEQIDVGGPTMIRSAAKNFKHVLVVVDPRDYDKLIKHINSHSGKRGMSTSRIHSASQRDDSGQARITFRKALAAKAFSLLSFYDSQIARYLNDELFPDELTIAGRKAISLRYGENPHQKAVVYTTPNANSPFERIVKKWGRDLSLVNVTDINAGIDSVELFDLPCAVVIKHNTPCGIALGKTAREALSRAIEADPESAFGGIIVINSTMDLKTAKVIGEFRDERKSNIDIVSVPAIDTKALEYLKNVRRSMGVYIYGHSGEKRTRRLQNRFWTSQNDDYHIKFIRGGFILQTSDINIDKSFLQWKTVTKKKPSAKQIFQMEIAWRFISRIKSNAVIVMDKDLPITRGIGSGQTSRVRSARIALEQAGNHAKGAILASDSFFPFDDSIKLAVKAGISAIVQQGGSINDQQSIDTANKARISMVFTDRRAFWH